MEKFQEQSPLLVAKRRLDSNRYILRKYFRKPILWWKSGASIHLFLSEIAIRFISCVPYAVVVDRTFSIQRLLHSKERNTGRNEKKPK